MILRRGPKWISFQFSSAIILTKLIQWRIQFCVEVLQIVHKLSELKLFASGDKFACSLVRLTGNSDDITLLKAFAKFLNTFEISIDCSISHFAFTSVTKYHWGTTEDDEQSEKQCPSAYQIMLPCDPGGVKNNFKNYLSSAWGQADF